MGHWGSCLGTIPDDAMRISMDGLTIMQQRGSSYMSISSQQRDLIDYCLSSLGMKSSASVQQAHLPPW